MLANLANVDAQLCALVAGNLGTSAPGGSPDASDVSSPALSQVPSGPRTIVGRAVGLLVAEGTDAAGVKVLRAGLSAEGANLYVIGPHGGRLPGHGGTVAVDRSMLTTQSVEYDALVVAGGSAAEVLGQDPYVAVNLGEAFRHCKTIAAWGAGQDVLERCGIAASEAGVIVGAACNKRFVSDLIEAIGWHRHWERVPSVAGRTPDPAGVEARSG
jgi:catalase